MLAALYSTVFTSATALNTTVPTSGHCSYCSLYFVLQNSGNPLKLLLLGTVCTKKSKLLDAVCTKVSTSPLQSILQSLLMFCMCCTGLCLAHNPDVFVAVFEMTEQARILWLVTMFNCSVFG